MNNNIILVGYPPVLLELIIKKFNSSIYRLIILEDDFKKVKKINSLNLSFLEVLNFNEGYELIKKSKINFTTYIGVSSNSKKRFKAFQKFDRFNIEFPNILQNSAKVSNYSKNSRGTYFGEYVTVEPYAEIDEFCFIQSHSHIGHDSKIGKFCILGGNVTINGNCQIGQFCLIGSSVTIINNKVIGKGSIIQAGTCITQNIPAFSFVSGNPCKIAPIEFLGKDFAELKKII